MTTAASLAVPCGRCGRGVRALVAEHCWYCSGPLCGDCWEEVGHCGHPEAHAANRALRRVHESH